MDAARIVLGFDGSRDDSPLVIGRVADDGRLQVETPSPLDCGALRDAVGQLCEASGTPRFLLPNAS